MAHHGLQPLRRDGTPVMMMMMMMIVKELMKLKLLNETYRLISPIKQPENNNINVLQKTVGNAGRKIYRYTLSFQC